MLYARMLYTSIMLESSTIVSYALEQGNSGSLRHAVPGLHSQGAAQTEGTHQDKESQAYGELSKDLQHTSVALQLIASLIVVQVGIHVLSAHNKSASVRTEADALHLPVLAERLPLL